jgi:hypothetical protein
VQGEVSRKNTVAVKRIKLAEIIDVEAMKIGRRTSQRDHYWDYPIKPHEPRFIDTITLPDHRSVAKIRRSSPPTELYVEFEGVFEINLAARPTQVLRRRNRPPPQFLNIGFNHVKLGFRIVVKRVGTNPFVYYNCSEGKAPTEELHHIFPRPRDVVDERDFQMDKGNGTMRMSGVQGV